MQWVEVWIGTTPEGIEPLSDRLIAIFPDGFEVEDGEDFNQFIEDGKKNWYYFDDGLVEKKTGISAIKLYLTDDLSGREELKTIKEALYSLKADRSDLDFGPMEIKLKNVDEEDWQSAWKQYYKPFKIGKHIVVVPKWENYNIDDGRKRLIMDPGMAFGTGTHASTRLCIEMMDEFIKPDLSVLDVGCGSGILSIASLMLGAKEAVGVDISPLAIKISYENALNNGFSSPVYRTYLSDLVFAAEDKYDLVVANIVADVVIALLKDVRKVLKPGGIIILSGIIAGREADVENALKENGFKTIRILDSEGWYAVAAK